MAILKYYKTLAKTGQEEMFTEPESYIFPLLKIATDETDKLILHKAISSATAYVKPGYTIINI